MFNLISENNRRNAVYCMDFIELSIGAVNENNKSLDRVLFCNGFRKGLMKLIEYSFTPMYSSYGGKLRKLGITQEVADEFLKSNTNEFSFYHQLTMFESQFYVLYNCKNPFGKCSSFEIAVQQWNTSVVT